MQTPRWLRVAAAILAALVAAVLTYTQAIDTGPDGAQRAAPRAVPRATATATPTPPPLAGAEHENLSGGDTELGPLRGATPTPDTLPGCVNRFNTHNFSSRNGIAVRNITAHYTVSPNVPGWADVDANANFLNLPSTQASALAIIDAEGHCLYTVPLKLKAWTEAGGNSFSAGIEFVGTGGEGKLSAAALAEGGRVVAEIARRESIPLQVGDVTGCSPIRPGVVDHAMYGACGGGHHDLRPYYGSRNPRVAADDAKVLGPLITAAKAAAAPTPAPTPTGFAVLTKGERAAAETLVRERAVAKRHGGWGKVDPSHLKAAVAAKNALKRADARITAAARRTGWKPANRAARHALIRRLI
jgi:hypothetical protein